MTANGTSPIGWLNLTNGGTVRILNKARSLRGMDVLEGAVIVDGASARFEALGGDNIRIGASDVNAPAVLVVTNNGTIRSSASTQVGFNPGFLGGAVAGGTNRFDISSGKLELFGSSSVLNLGNLASLRFR